MGKRYWIDCAIIFFAMSSLLASLCMTITFSQIPNHFWNSILNCTTVFPTKGNDFSGKRLICPPPNVIEQHYRDNARRFSGHEIFAILLQVLVAVVGLIAVAPTWCKKKFRVAPYLVNMELVFGSLGLFTLPSVIALAFSLQEYYSDIVATLNEDDSVDISHKIDLTVVNRTFLNVPSQTWRSIDAACVIKDQSIRWAGVVSELSPNLMAVYKQEFMVKDIIHNQTTYDYGLLKSLGFCPSLYELDIAAGILIISTILFFVLPLTNVCVKHSAASVSATKLQEDEALNEDEESKTVQDVEGIASLTTFNTEDPEDDDDEEESTLVTESVTTTLAAPSSSHMTDEPSEMSVKTDRTGTTGTTFTSIAASKKLKNKVAKKKENTANVKPDVKENFRKTLEFIEVKRHSRTSDPKKPKLDYSIDLSGINTSDLSSLYDESTPKKKKKQMQAGAAKVITMSKVKKKH